MNKPADVPAQAGGNFWKEYAAEEWTDAVVASMKLGGVDHLYFVSGTELAYYQEAITKAEAQGRGLEVALVVGVDAGFVSLVLGAGAPLAGRTSATKPSLRRPAESWAMPAALTSRLISLTTSWNGMLKSSAFFMAASTYSLPSTSRLTASPASLNFLSIRPLYPCESLWYLYNSV